MDGHHCTGHACEFLSYPLVWGVSYSFMHLCAAWTTATWKYKVEHRYPVLMIVVTMAPLPDIHGFKWVQLSPNQCQTRCHYVVHYICLEWHAFYLFIYIYIYTYKYICHMGSHKMKVTDSALYVTCASGVIFLISPYFLCDISHITPRGQSQTNYGHSPMWQNT